jgi:hypothetical protein
MLSLECRVDIFFCGCVRTEDCSAVFIVMGNNVSVIDVAIICSVATACHLLEEVSSTPSLPFSLAGPRRRLCRLSIIFA